MNLLASAVPLACQPLAQGLGRGLLRVPAQAALEPCLRKSRCRQAFRNPPKSSDEPENSPWNRSFSVNDDNSIPLGIRIFGIGSRLADVICEVRDGAKRDAVPPERQLLIDQLNRHFGNVRDVLHSPDLAEASALLNPVIDRFRETLDQAAEQPGSQRLASQCAALTEELNRLLRPRLSRPRTEPDSWDDLPF